MKFLSNKLYHVHQTFREYLQPTFTRSEADVYFYILLEDIVAVSKEKYLAAGLWDEATRQIGNKNFIKGLLAPAILQKESHSIDIQDNKLITYYNPSPR